MKKTHNCRCFPGMLDVWSRAQLQAWYDFHGPFMTYDGKMWEPDHVKVAPDRYRVRMKEFKA